VFPFTSCTSTMLTSLTVRKRGSQNCSTRSLYSSANVPSNARLSSALRFSGEPKKVRNMSEVKLLTSTGQETGSTSTTSTTSSMLWTTSSSMSVVTVSLNAVANSSREGARISWLSSGSTAQTQGSRGESLSDCKKRRPSKTIPRSFGREPELSSNRSSSRLHPKHRPVILN